MDCIPALFMNASTFDKRKKNQSYCSSNSKWVLFSLLTFCCLLIGQNNSYSLLMGQNISSFYNYHCTLVIEGVWFGYLFLTFDLKYIF